MVVAELEVEAAPAWALNDGGLEKSDAARRIGGPETRRDTPLNREDDAPADADCWSGLGRRLLVEDGVGAGGDALRRAV